ncbi:hypothetical protein A8926_6189 [Saccharopolyspora spinosa]|uniref:Uncharacterized protein n=1 Tax=Saccharopolyspora spinosa TaxID=60894 RepID=A0A2N3Y5B2_SACSN|nr:hypothetical protein A8926_6189 [Saccharopolyspora spinosa]
MRRRSSSPSRRREAASSIEIEPSISMELADCRRVASRHADACGQPPQFQWKSWAGTDVPGPAAWKVFVLDGNLRTGYGAGADRTAQPPVSKRSTTWATCRPPGQPTCPPPGRPATRLGNLPPAWATCPPPGQPATHLPARNYLNRTGQPCTRPERAGINDAVPHPDRLGHGLACPHQTGKPERGLSHPSMNHCDHSALQILLRPAGNLRASRTPAIMSDQGRSHL